MLHHEVLTPTLRATNNRRADFLAKINAAAKAHKSKPVVIRPIESFGPIVIKAPPPTPDDIAFGPVVLFDPRLPTVKEVIRETANYFDISGIEIRSQQRCSHFVLPRQIAMYLCRTLTMRSLPFIGEQLGDRDHSTVIHGARKIQGQIIAGNQVVIEAVDNLTALLSK